MDRPGGQSERLIEGITRFRERGLGGRASLFRELSEHGQHPHTLFITCSDSRVVPHVLVSAEPGDLFVVRVLGGIVPTGDHGGSVISALEYAIAILGVSDVVVCGHSDCGAMRALDEGMADELSHLRAWIDHGETLSGAVLTDSADPADRVRLTTQRNVALSIERLRAHPLIRQTATRIQGWYYEIATGQVSAYDGRTETFTVIN